MMRALCALSCLALAQAAAAQAEPPQHPDNWEQVEGVYFRSYAGFGVGGMVTFFNFEPLVLFDNGTYYAVDGEALEDVDLAQSRRAEPGRWGRWSRRGARFTLTDHEGDASDAELQDGAFFLAFPAEAGGGRLRAAYKSASGGGNSALGGEMTIAVQARLVFSADGSFSGGSSVSALGSGDATGVATATASARTAAGRYRIEHHTITLIEPDGREQRRFFAFSSAGAPPRPDTDMIFIGDQTYVIEK